MACCATFCATDLATSGGRRALVGPTGHRPWAEFVTADGELAVVDGVLTFTPAPGYSGRSEVMYVVSDAEGLVSAPVMVTLRVSEPG